MNKDTRSTWRVTMDLPEVTLLGKPVYCTFEDAACYALELVDTMARSAAIVPRDQDMRLVLSAANQLIPTSLKSMDVLAQASDGNCVISLQQQSPNGSWLHWDEEDPA